MSQDPGSRIGEESPIEVTSEFSLLNGKFKYQYSAASYIGEVIGYYDSGAIRFRYPLMSGSLHGAGRTWYENGALLSEESFLFGRQDGRKRVWYPDGTLKFEASYKFGCRDGECKEWYENGKLRRQCAYVPDRIGSSHILHGMLTEWYPSGKLRLQANYAFGVLHGTHREWKEDGSLADKRTYVRGVRISGELSRHIDNRTLAANHILKITNSAVRRICLEELGYGRFLSQVPHEVADKDGEYELVKIDWHKREEPIFLVKVKCPSTGAFYTLRVPPAMKTVKEAVAWTFGLKGSEYSPEAET